ncbi:MAG: TolC family protein [Nannocystales bacterium]
MIFFGRSSGLSIRVCLALSLPACASSSPQQNRDLRSVEETLSDPVSQEDTAAPAGEFDGTLGGYVAYAYAHSPALRASFETWRAATFRPDQERRLPEPTISYAVFVRSVETRVGPQRHRFGASQWFPWPTTLRAGSEAAGLEAQAAQRRFESHALVIAAEVSVAYWTLWRLRRQGEVLRDEIDVLQSLSEQVQGRLAVGAAELSDLAQIDLVGSRARDRHASVLQHQRVASVQLVRVLGAPYDTVTPVSPREPEVAGLAETSQELRTAAGEHPDVQTLATLSDAAGHREREARAERAPSFGVGVDWILTGEAPAHLGSVDSGKDAVALSLSMKVPLWSRAYKAGASEARARGAALRSRALDARNGVAAQVGEHAALVEDAVRRVEAYGSTLIPQAQTAFESVLASFTSGRATVAELLIAEQALLGLRAERFAAQADYGTHLAQLERAVGRPVRRSRPNSLPDKAAFDDDPR